MSANDGSPTAEAATQVVDPAGTDASLWAWSDDYGEFRTSGERSVGVDADRKSLVVEDGPDVSEAPVIICIRALVRQYGRDVVAGWVTATEEPGQ